MLAAAKEMYRQYEARRTRRVQTFIPATVVLAGRSQSVQMLDLSTDGTLLHVEGRLPVGQKVWLLRNGLDVFARVAWCQGARAGLHFERRLSDQQYDGLLRSKDNHLMATGTA